ncbi:MAG: ComEC/Rec2 family competence protein [Patescibacteria group bacterium]
MESIAKSPSKTLFLWCSVFIFGVALGPLFLFLPESVFLVPLVLFIILLALVRKQTIAVLLFSAIFFSFGAFRYYLSEPTPNSILVSERTGQTMSIKGAVVAEVEKQENHSRIIIDNIYVVNERVEGKIQVWTSRYIDVQHGDTIVFACKLEAPKPIESFAYDKYLQTKGIYALCFYPENIIVKKTEEFSFVGSILDFKSKAIKRINLILHEPHSSFATGLLFGGNSALSKDIQDDFSRTGTSHILAASGFNVSLFVYVFLAWIITTRFGRKRGIILTAILILIYVFAAGATPAVIRAGIMASLFLVGKLVSRKPYLPNILLFTAALMLLFNPKILLWDVGFQLSFIATASILFVAPVWEKRFLWIPNFLELRKSFVGSLGAILFTLPIVIWHFGAVSIVSVFANLLVLPFVPIALGVIVISLFVSVLSYGLASITVLPAWGLLGFMLYIIRFLSSTSFASLEIGFQKTIALIVAFVIFFIWWFQHQGRQAK